MKLLLDRPAKRRLDRRVGRDVKIVRAVSGVIPHHALYACTH